MAPRTMRKKSRSQAGIPKHKWQHKEDDQLLELARTDMTWKEISERIGRNESACAKRYYRYLVTKSVDDLTRMRVVRLYNQYKKEMWRLVAREAGLPEVAVENIYWEFREKSTGHEDSQSNTNDLRS